MLQKKNPDDRYYFIMGADSLLYLDKWYKPEEIFKRAVILAIGRNCSTSAELVKKRKELIEYFNNKYNSNGIDKISKIIDRAIYLSPNDDYETIDNTIKTYLKINEIKEIYNEEC